MGANPLGGDRSRRGTTLLDDHQGTASFLEVGPRGLTASGFVGSRTCKPESSRPAAINVNKTGPRVAIRQHATRARRRTPGGLGFKRSRGRQLVVGTTRM